MPEGRERETERERERERDEHARETQRLSIYVVAWTSSAVTHPPLIRQRGHGMWLEQGT